MSKVVLSLLLMLCAAVVRAGDREDASQLYDDGKFEPARARFEQIVARGEATANVFYNLANTLHRLGRPGEAILYYERALRLDPAHPEARANLALLRRQSGAIVWPERWWNVVLAPRWVNGLAVAGVLGLWIAVFALASIFTRRTTERFGRWTLVVLGLAGAALGAVAVWSAEQERQAAIVVAKDAGVYLAPAQSSGPASTLPAGSEVRVLGERGEWIYCALPEGRRWLSAKAIARVRPSGS